MLQYNLYSRNGGCHSTYGYGLPALNWAMEVQQVGRPHGGLDSGHKLWHNPWDTPDQILRDTWGSSCCKDSYISTGGPSHCEGRIEDWVCMLLHTVNWSPTDVTMHIVCWTLLLKLPRWHLCRDECLPNIFISFKPVPLHPPVPVWQREERQSPWLEAPGHTEAIHRLFPREVPCCEAKQWKQGFDTLTTSIKWAHAKRWFNLCE